MKNFLIILIATAGFTVSAMDRFAALSMIESGDCDSCVGAAGEVSRFQILPSVWRQYTKLPLSAATNPVTARNVVEAIMQDRCLKIFKEQDKYIIHDEIFYLTWHRPATVTRGRNPSAKELDRAFRFANLCAIKP